MLLHGQRKSGNADSTRVRTGGDCCRRWFVFLHQLSTTGCCRLDDSPGNRGKALIRELTRVQLRDEAGKQRLMIKLASIDLEP